MISLEAKTETTTSVLPIGTSLKEEEPNISFSSLLKGLQKEDKVIQNGALVLSLKDEQEVSKDTLLSLLKFEDKALIEPKVIQNMSVKEIKTLISEAKEYLKEKILRSDDYKLMQTKELPKTLKGLSVLAQKLGIDVSKITIEEVRSLMAEKRVSKEPRKEAQVKNEEVQRVEDKRVQEPKQPTVAKETPLFKAQMSKEHTTEQLVVTKVLKAEEKTPKSRADETLKQLLRGEKPLQVNLTAGFSVATAKGIAPPTGTEKNKSLESLLYGEEKENSISSKLDGLTTHKADSFEVKVNEAKQMIKYISSDIKSAIEDYKSPFTRVKVQLNPQKLGEVDLMIVSRGKNLHVTLSANNAAINTLSANANELRTQLNNNGINNASLNFNNSSQNSEQNTQQGQQHRQNEQKANEEQNEEIVSSLEIVTPSYA